MFDQIIFGEKLKSYRKELNLTQEELGEKIGVSGQAVSKWEKGECLPDCYNLKMLGDLYGVSLDILLDTENVSDFASTINKIKQIATEFIWKAHRETPDIGHVELGNNLWEMWKSIYYIEIGNRELQEREMKHGKNRIMSRYGVKMWDDNGGIACVVKAAMLDKLDSVTDNDLSLIQTLASTDYYNLLKLFNCDVVSKETLLEKTSYEPAKLNEMIVYMTENHIIEFHKTGYKLTVNRGIIPYMILAAAYALTSVNHSTSEYIPS